jgi:hypothetical protein
MLNAIPFLKVCMHPLKTDFKGSPRHLLELRTALKRPEIAGEFWDFREWKLPQNDEHTSDILTRNRDFLEYLWSEENRICSFRSLDDRLAKVANQSELRTISTPLPDAVRQKRRFSERWPLYTEAALSSTT